MSHKEVNRPDGAPLNHRTTKAGMPVVGGLFGGLFVALFVALLPGYAAAKPARTADKAQRACASLYQTAKQAVDEGQLTRANEVVADCLRSSCGSSVMRQCVTLRSQLDTDVPSIVPFVTDDRGMPHVQIEVRVDGDLVISKLDGLGLPLDPGKHEITFSNARGVFAKKTVLIVQGERNRPIAARLHLMRKAKPSGVEDVGTNRLVAAK